MYAQLTGLLHSQKRAGLTELTGGNGSLFITFGYFGTELYVFVGIFQEVNKLHYFDLGLLTTSNVPSK